MCLYDNMRAPDFSLILLGTAVLNLEFSVLCFVYVCLYFCLLKIVICLFFDIRLFFICAIDNTRIVVHLHQFLQRHANVHFWNGFIILIVCHTTDIFFSFYYTFIQIRFKLEHLLSTRIYPYFLFSFTYASHYFSSMDTTLSY
jgi:hypothetical protein